MTTTEPRTQATTDTHTVLEVPASELLPGDVVLYPDGSRAWAAFDVAFDADRDRYVTAWTALPDQDAGHPERYHLVPIAPVTVRRRDGGPRVTRTTVFIPAPPKGDRHDFDPGTEASRRGERRTCATCGNTERATVHGR